MDSVAVATVRAQDSAEGPPEQWGTVADPLRDKPAWIRKLLRSVQQERRVFVFFRRAPRHAYGGRA